MTPSERQGQRRKNEGNAENEKGQRQNLQLQAFLDFPHLPKAGKYGPPVCFWCEQTATRDAAETEKSWALKKRR
jgi:hypothetical protein